MTAFKSVTDRGVDFMLNSLYPSNYQRQNPAEPLTLLQNRKAKTVGHTILSPIRALTRMVLWAGVGALTPKGVVQHGSMCAVHAAKWMKHKSRKEFSKEQTEWKNLKTRFVPFAQDLTHLGLFLLTLRGATTVAANKGILSPRIFHQLPGLFKMSWNAELASRLPEVLKTLPYSRQIAGQLELKATAVAAIGYTAFMMYAAAKPAELLFCGSIDNAAEKTRIILGYALKNACGAVKEDGSCVTINEDELSSAFVASWTILLESIKTARGEKIDIPYDDPLKVEPIMDYVKKHSERIRPELQAELVKNCRLVAETGELLRILLSESRPVLTPPPCPIEAGEYFPKIEKNLMMLGDSSPTRRQLNRSWMTGAIETMLGSAWLCPSNVKERPINDKGALEDTLGNIDFFEGREVKGRLHQLTKPLRVVARTVYILAAMTIIAPLGFLYHAGRIALAAVKIKKAPIGQHFRAGRSDGIYAVAGAIFATGVALNIAVRKHPELLLRRWVPKASIGLLQPVFLITLVAMGTFSTFRRETFQLFIEHDLVGAALKSYLFKEYFGLVSSKGSLLSYVEADSNEGLNFSLLSARRLTYWMDLYGELRKLDSSDIIYDQARPLTYIQKQYSDNQEILKLVERCRIINEVYNTLADQNGIEFWEMPPPIESCFLSKENHHDNFGNVWKALKNVKEPVGMNGEFADIYNRATDSCSPWAVLGVPYGASADKLQRARLKILLVVSPDKQTRRPDAEAYTDISVALTQCVGEAYEIAKDETNPLHTKYSAMARNPNQNH